MVNKFPREDDDDVGEVLDGIDHIEKLAWWATTFVNVVCGILGLFLVIYSSGITNLRE